MKTGVQQGLRASIRVAAQRERTIRIQMSSASSPLAELYERHVGRMVGLARQDGDLQLVSAVLADDVSWPVPGTNAIAGDYVGLDAVLNYFMRCRALAKGRVLITHHCLLRVKSERVAEW